MSPCIQNAKVNIIHAGYHHGQRKKGVELGPKYVLDEVLLGKLALGTVIECKQFEFNDENGEKGKEIVPYYLHEPEAMAMAARRVFDAVMSLKGMDQVLVVGGDHSIAIGSVAAQLQRGNPDNIAVLWVDAHADLNTLMSTTSGNLHGCPVSFLLGKSGTALNHLFSWYPQNIVLNPENLAYIGLRDVDPAEETLLKQLNIKHWRAEQVRETGIQTIMQQLLDYWGSEKDVYVSFDIDALDPTIAPATGTPVPNGLTLDDGVHIFQHIRRNYRSLIGMDLVEVNPQIIGHDDKGLEGVQMTIQSAQTLIKAAFL